jgi:hypothetical protein
VLIDVVVFEPGEDGTRREIEDSLDSMREVVGGGWIEVVPITRDLAVVCDEEGRLRGLPPNRWGFVGAFFVVRREGADLVSLTARDEREVERLVAEDRDLVG